MYKCYTGSTLLKQCFAAASSSCLAVLHCSARLKSLQLTNLAQLILLTPQKHAQPSALHLYMHLFQVAAMRDSLNHAVEGILDLDMEQKHNT
jgi:hypothetical protein